MNMVIASVCHSRCGPSHDIHRPNGTELASVCVCVYWKRCMVELLMSVFSVNGSISEWWSGSKRIQVVRQ